MDMIGNDFTALCLEFSFRERAKARALRSILAISRLSSRDVIYTQYTSQ